MSNASVEKQIDDYIAHFAVTATGKLLLKRQLRPLLEQVISLGKSLYDIDSSIVAKELAALQEERPWVSINHVQ